MTTRELYSSIGVSGYEHWGCMRKGRIFHLRMEAPSSCHKCPKCGVRDAIHQGTYVRIVHEPRIGLDRTVLFIKAPRLECRRCQPVLNAVLPKIEPRCNYMKSLARLVADLRKMMTIKDVAHDVGVSDTMIRGIVKKYLCRRFGKPRLRHRQIIAIDEIYVGKNNKFFTIVIDWLTGAIVFVGYAKGENALKSFWKRLRGLTAKITAVATDMSSAYYSAVLKNLPNAKHVFDRFHIV
jgi:transposase